MNLTPLPFKTTILVGQFTAWRLRQVIWTQTLQAELLFLAQISTKSFRGWGFAPDAIGGAYSAPSNPLAVFRGPTFKGMKEGKSMRGRKEKGKRGEGESE